MSLDRPSVETVFDRLYGGTDALSIAYREGRASRAKLMSEVRRDMAEADAGAPSPLGFSDDTGRLVLLIRRDPSIRVAFLALGGWDTHVSQGAAQGQLATHLAQLAAGLSGFAKALGPEYQHTVVLVISEFVPHRKGKRQRWNRSRTWQCDVGDGRSGPRRQGVWQMARPGDVRSLPGT